MKTIRSLTTEEMIGEFLQAELHSSRFREGSLKALDMLGYNEDLLENPDYNSVEDNGKRARVLSLCRGWPDTNLFVNFPKDTIWYLVKLSQEELSQFFRLKSSPAMTDDERLLSNTVSGLREKVPVANVDPGIIDLMKQKINQKIPMPPIILVSNSFKGKKVLIEGHSRSIAYCSVDTLDNSESIPAIIGLSEQMPHWDYY